MFHLFPELTPGAGDRTVGVKEGRGLEVPVGHVISLGSADRVSDLRDVVIYVGFVSVAVTDLDNSPLAETTVDGLHAPLTVDPDLGRFVRGTIPLALETDHESLVVT